MITLAGSVALGVKLDTPVRFVRVVGDLTASEQQQIQDTVTPYVGTGLLTVDLDRVAAAVRSLSWPRQVTVRRLWPPGLELHVAREHAVAAWGDDGYVTGEGRVRQFAEVTSGLPVFVCQLSTPPQAMAVYDALQQSLAGTGMAITELSESSLGEWQVGLDNGVRVLLGRDALVARLHRFSRVYQHALAASAPSVRSVDARYGNGVAVRWRESLVAYEEKAAHGY